MPTIDISEQVKNSLFDLKGKYGSKTYNGLIQLLIAYSENYVLCLKLVEGLTNHYNGVQEFLKNFPLPNIPIKNNSKKKD